MSTRLDLQRLREDVALDDGGRLEDQLLLDTDRAFYIAQDLSIVGDNVTDYATLRADNDLALAIDVALFRSRPSNRKSDSEATLPVTTVPAASTLCIPPLLSGISSFFVRTMIFYVWFSQI